MAKRMTRPQGGLERDTFSKWCRRYLCYFQHAGKAKEGKRSYSRRDRRNTKQQLRRGEGSL